MTINKSIGDSKLNIGEELARIDRDRAKTIKLEIEVRKLDEERRVYIDRQLAEIRKFDADARRQDRERWQGWQIVVSAMVTGAALCGAGAAFMKVLIG